MRDMGRSPVRSVKFAAALRPGFPHCASYRCHSFSRAEPERSLVAENSERFQLSMQGGSLHSDKGRRSGYIAAEARYLSEQVFPLKNLTRFAQRQGHDLAGLVPFDDARG